MKSTKPLCVLIVNFIVLAVYGQGSDPLLFPKDAFTTETKVVHTSGGEKRVTYRAYLHIVYVASPVDKDYQSMNVLSPVDIDGKKVDLENAAIFFDIGVGGYMSVNNAGNDGKNLNRRSELALAAGFVVVSPGCRGRDNRFADGTFYGKAPAAIVDLKAAVRYLRHNKKVMPGNPERIVSVGCSAGGALSALLGSSGNSPLYEQYLKEAGAANEPDNIFASACYSPITDLEHADGAYEWMYGEIPARSGPVDRELSRQLKDSFTVYQKSLSLQGRNNFGILTSDNYSKYLLIYFLVPSANKYLQDLQEDARNEYLKSNTWISWNGKAAEFSFNDYLKNVGRMKGLPAFDDFSMRQPEPSLFGDKNTPARHFTDFSLQNTTGDRNASISEELKTIIGMMNAMYFLGNNRSDIAGHWWLRNGSRDNHTSQTVMVNLATILENKDKHVNAFVFWNGGHCADDDPEGLINWIGTLSF